MRKIFLSILFVATGYIVSAQEFATITFDSLEIDYGIINKGDDGVRQFKFTNTGTALLKITQVRSSCGVQYPRNLPILLHLVPRT